MNAARAKSSVGCAALDSARAAAVWLLLFLAGCMHPAPFDSARVGPFFAPANHYGDSSLGGVRRVVVLPLWAAGTIAPESAAALDDVLVAALQRENRFEIVPLGRAECRWRFGAGALASASALPADLLSTLRREFAADGVLLVDLTVFQPYSPLAIGLRGKLASTEGGRLIWTFDNLFAADEPAVANSARRYFLGRDPDVPTDLTGGVLQSPSRFGAYAAAAMFATLPPVAPPIAMKPAR